MDRIPDEVERLRWRIAYKEVLKVCADIVQQKDGIKAATLIQNLPDAFKTVN